MATLRELDVGLFYNIESFGWSRLAIKLILHASGIGWFHVRPASTALLLGGIQTSQLLVWLNKCANSPNA